MSKTKNILLTAGMVLAMVMAVAVNVYAQHETCHECNGTGKIRINCSQCSGSGTVKQPTMQGDLMNPASLRIVMTNTTCTACNGTGAAHSQCSTCRGTGKITPSPAQQTEQAKAAFERGSALYDKKDYDGAITKFTKAIKLRPDFFGSYYGRGIAYSGKENWDSAIADFTQAIRLDPNYAKSYGRRAVAYYYKGDIMRALADCDEVKRLVKDEGDIAILFCMTLDMQAPAEKQTAPPPATPAKDNFITDSRDKQTYKTVVIGTQTWMAENLNYNASDSKCYNDDPANCKKYGRLYNWGTAKKACPSGWHLPSKSEYEVLDNAVGGEKVAGKKLKVKSGWNNNGNGTDEFGFSALPGGGGLSDGSFYGVGNLGYWWSASEDNSTHAYGRAMDYNYVNASWRYLDKTVLFSVRCIKD